MLVLVEVEMAEEQKLPIYLRPLEEVEADKETSSGNVRLFDLDYWYVYWLHAIDEDTPNKKSFQEILGPIVRTQLADLYELNRKRIEDLREHRIKEHRLKKSGGAEKQPLKGRRKPE